MYYLIGAIALLIIIVTVGAVIQKRRGGNPTEVVEDPPVECCGGHEVCPTETLLNVDNKIVYYDDEELDRFAGRAGNSYDDDETEEFLEVLLTMNESDVIGWLRSLTLRNIDLPSVVKEQALMLVEEIRQRNS